MFIDNLNISDIPTTPSTPEKQDKRTRNKRFLQETFSPKFGVQQWPQNIIYVTRSDQTIKIIRNNENYCKLIGCVSDVGKTIDQRVWTEDIDNFLLSLDLAQEGEENSTSTELRMIRNDNFLFWCRLTVVYQAQENGLPCFRIAIENIHNSVNTQILTQTALRLTGTNVWFLDLIKHTLTFVCTQKNKKEYSGIPFLEQGITVLENYPKNTEDLIRFKEEYAEEMRAFEKKLARGDVPNDYTLEVPLLQKDDSVVWLLFHGDVIRDEKGDIVRIVGTYSDITTIKKNETRLRINSQLIQTLQSNVIKHNEINLSKDIICKEWSIEKNFTIETRNISPIFSQQVNYYAQHIVLPDYREKFLEFLNINRLIALENKVKQSPQILEFQQIYRGFPQWVRVSIVLWRNEIKRDVMMTASLIKVNTYSDNHGTEFHIDELSGLFCKQPALNMMQNFIHDHPKTPAAVTMIDIDNFKSINDSLGHLTGDKVLHRVAQMMRTYFEDNAILSRFGGDEFVLLYYGEQQTYDHALNTFAKNLAEPFTIDSHCIQLTVSIGYASFPEHSQDFHQLLTFADQAMYFAKRSGKNAIIGYDPKITTSENFFKFNLRSLIEGIPCGFLIYQAQYGGKILFANERMLEICKCDSHRKFFEYTESSCVTLVHPDDYRFQRQLVVDMKHSDRSQYGSSNYRLMRQDGTFIMVHVQRRLFHSEQQDLVYTFIEPMEK